MEQSIEIDVPQRNIIRMTTRRGKNVVDIRDIPYAGPVDTKLLTTIDNLFQENILDKFASINVAPGKGVDKSTLLYRIIITLGAALSRARP